MIEKRPGEPTSKAPQRLAKPEWLKIRPPAGERYTYIKQRARQLGLVTVCEQAHCPNLAECWSHGTATFMAMGEICTRSCRFCNVKSGRPAPLDSAEPTKLAAIIAELALDYVVLTSVDRDDLPDGGAAHLAATVRCIRERLPAIGIEILIPDFRGDRSCLAVICASGPKVVAHNIETTEALTPLVRDARAGYQQSLAVLRLLKALGAPLTKSSLMLGLGESAADVMKTLKDLRTVDCDIVTLGQYLQPGPRHLPVKEFLSPERFANYRSLALDLGFGQVAAGPLVRSSYRAGELAPALNEHDHSGSD
ncbi:MAG: lipoyl synthase [Cyanobacteria bacterium NC_groundwater_1444_Ag_S-0.65um_54_12]|nr:lipoyl synthase [Cyanobacteria bacterium NC_groundwater_1444_Ag_S-0.65um_54_12]